MHNNRNIKNTILIFGVACLLTLATSCNEQKKAQPHFAVPVSAIQLHTSLVDQTMVYQASLLSRHSVSLQPQVAGQISNIYVKAGDKVQSNSPLILIDPRIQQAALNSSKADAEAIKALINQAKDTLNNYQSQHISLQSNLALNQKLYNRYSVLYAKHAASLQTLEQYTDSLNKARADLASNIAQIQAQKSAVVTAQKNYEKAKATVASESVKLQYYKIIAPYSGTIGDIPVKIGSYVSTSTPLLSITQNDPLEINVGIPAEKIFELHKGLPVEVLNNNGDTIGKSQVFFVSPRVNTDTQTVLLKANLHNPKGILKADQSVKVRIIYKQMPGILVSTKSIAHVVGQDFVFVINKKGKQTFVKQQPVKLGDIQNDKYVVISGLHDGDKIVSEGIQKLTDGAPVMILKKGQ